MTRCHRPSFVCTVSFLALLSAAAFARSADERYRLEIAPLGSPPIRPVVLTCPGETVCRGQIVLTIDGAPQPVTVVAMFMAGYAFIKFATERMTLGIWNREYVAIPYDESRLAQETVAVSERAAFALDDDENLFHRPVIRTPVRPIAEVHIDIRPAD